MITFWVDLLHVTCFVGDWKHICYTSGLLLIQLEKKILKSINLLTNNNKEGAPKQYLEHVLSFAWLLSVCERVTKGLSQLYIHVAISGDGHIHCNPGQFLVQCDFAINNDTRVFLPGVPRFLAKRGQLFTFKKRLGDTPEINKGHGLPIKTKVTQCLKWSDPNVIKTLYYQLIC